MQSARQVGNGSAVIPARTGYDASLPFVGAQAEQSERGAAHFKGASTLEILQLEIDHPSGQTTEEIGSDEWRAQGHRSDGYRRATHIDAAQRVYRHCPPGGIA
jgi:hypothetical protein